MKLYRKWLLAFALVIAAALAVVAALVSQRTESELLRYSGMYSSSSQRIAGVLSNYYEQTGSWEGVQSLVQSIVTRPGMIGDAGREHGGMRGWTGLRVADANGRIVGDSDHLPQGELTAKDRSLAVEIQDQEGATIGYLLLAGEPALEAPAQDFLDRMRVALFWGALAAFAVAILVGGVLVRGIVAPLQGLNAATHAISGGDLSARAPVHGHDEIAMLAETFNQMAENLQRAQEARRAQTADIAHELRNPLAVLQGTLEALADGVYEPAPENFDLALDQVRTLNRLVEDLRLLALADAGELRLERTSLDLGSWLMRAVDVYRPAFEEKAIGLDVEVPEGLPSISVDGGRLGQVISNVLGNAQRYLPAGSRVRVTVALKDGGIEMRMADNGPGVPAEELPKLFERFWRGEHSRSRALGGSGLGLAIARQIVTAHGGRIKGEKTPGGGLTVVCWLPLK